MVYRLFCVFLRDAFSKVDGTGGADNAAEVTTDTLGADDAAEMFHNCYDLSWLVINILSKLHEQFRTLCVQKYTILIKAPIKESILT